MQVLKANTIIKLAAGATVGTSLGILGFTDATDLNGLAVVRIARAGATVARITADYKWTFLTIKAPVDSQEYRDAISGVHLRSAEHLKELCCKNRGVFIKVGQHIGSLDYLLPSEYVLTMKTLFRDAPQSSFQDLLGVLEGDFHQSPWTIFKEIDPEPLGAASLAQVHKATLFDGSTVAVKIQHPKVEERSHIDLKAMDFFVRTVEKIFPEFQFAWLAEETKKILPKELDFLHEGKNCEFLGKLLKKFSFVKVPKIYWEHSTKRVLVMEYCEGGRVDDLSFYDRNKISPGDIMCKISRLFSEMIFIDGYLHCDPHPGNILVSKDSKGRPLITLLDHGIHQTITEKTRIAYSKLWLSLLNSDVPGIQKHADELGVGEMYGLFACMLTARSWKGVTGGIQDTSISEQEMNDIKEQAGALLPQISAVLSRVPREVLLILKTNDLLRGLSYKLKIPTNPCAFSTISMACTKVVFVNKIKHADSAWKSLLFYSKMWWMIFKIKAFELYLSCFRVKPPMVL